MSEERKLGIIEVLQRVGEANIGVQFLDQCMAGADYSRKHGTTVKFATDQIDPRELVTGNVKKFGIILWISREDRDRVHREFKAEAGAA